MTIDAVIYESSSMTYTKSLYQHDKNVTLVFKGIDLPETYEVHFSNDKERGISVACEGDSSGVKIPDELLSTGSYVYAWVCKVENEMGKSTSFEVVIPVIPRPIPIPVTKVETGFKYRIDEGSEDLAFFGAANNMLIPNIEPEEIESTDN